MTSPHLYSVTALPSKTYTTANTDATFLNVQSFKFHSKQFCTLFHGCCTYSQQCFMTTQLRRNFCSQCFLF